jgi:hypothetical protein
MLIWNYVILVIRVDGLMLAGHADFLDGELDTGEILEQIGMVGGM